MLKVRVSKCITNNDGEQSRQSAKLLLQSFELGLPHPLTRRRVSPPFAIEGAGGPNSNEGIYTVVL
jgi:hypothetical protein